MIQRATADKRSSRRGPICRICVHKRVAEIDADLREFHELKKKGQFFSFSWLAETHFPEEYDITASRQAFQRHMMHHLGIKA